LAKVHLDAMLSEFVPKRTVRSAARSLDALLDDLEARYPRLRHRLRDETEALRPFVRVFVNGEEVRPNGKRARLLGPRDEVDILHSIQGG
jgi:molybdopterin converting factor small subunit